MIRTARLARPVGLRGSSGTLGHVLASGALARVVARFALHPTLTVHFRALQRYTGLSHRSLQLELERLRQFGLVRREAVGRTVSFRVVTAHPGWAALRNLVREFATPTELLRVALASVPGIDGAFIYGSFARGMDVHQDSDVDVFVVGEALDQPEIRIALSAATLEVAGFLGRDVNLTRFTPRKLESRFQSGRSAQFVESVLAGAKDWLVGDESVLRSLRIPRRKRGALTTRQQVHRRPTRTAARRVNERG